MQICSWIAGRPRPALPHGRAHRVPTIGRIPQGVSTLTFSWSASLQERLHGRTGGDFVRRPKTPDRQTREETSHPSKKVPGTATGPGQTDSPPSPTGRSGTPTPAQSSDVNQVKDPSPDRTSPSSHEESSALTNAMALVIKRQTAMAELPWTGGRLTHRASERERNRLWRAATTPQHCPQHAGQEYSTRRRQRRGNSPPPSKLLTIVGSGATTTGPRQNLSQSNAVRRLKVKTRHGYDFTGAQHSS